MKRLVLHTFEPHYDVRHGTKGQKDKVGTKQNPKNKSIRQSLIKGQRKIDFSVDFYFTDRV